MGSDTLRITFGFYFHVYFLLSQRSGDLRGLLLLIGILFCFVTGSHTVVQAGLELIAILLGLQSHFALLIKLVFFQIILRKIS